MAIELNEAGEGKMLEVRVSGKLTTEEYKKFIPTLERLIEERGKVDILFEMADFHGWETGAMWEDTKVHLTACK